MEKLSERINAAKALAVERTRSVESELSWFIAAFTPRFGPNDSVISMAIVCYFRSLHFYANMSRAATTTDSDLFASASVEALADWHIEFVRSALDSGSLVVDDAPFGPIPEHLRNRSLAGTATGAS